jgi:hypothetical protein
MTVSDLLLQADGILPDASTSHVELVQSVNGINKSFIIDTSDENITDNILLSSKAHISVRRDPDWIENRFVFLDGAVQYPGSYIC